MSVRPALHAVASGRVGEMGKVDVDIGFPSVEALGRKAGGTFSTFFSQDDCIGLVDVEGATVSLMTIQDVSAVVTEAGTYGFKVTITQSSANSVRYTTEYALIITYRRSVP